MFKVIKNRKELQRHIKDKKNIGLIPTMGNIHQGHLSLIRQSLEENLINIVTIFVNAKQFERDEDFNQYPRTPEQDINLISKLYQSYKQKDLIIFFPQQKDIYPKGFSTYISIDKEITNKLCGTLRPNHFIGVATVVYRLFKITNPTIAYFGQKDFQQFVVIKTMIRDLELNINLKLMPIVRNKHGLALSSRNSYLKDNQKEDALKLRKNILKVKQTITNKKDIISAVNKLNIDKSLEYIEILDADNLLNPTNKSKKLIILGAMKIGNTRIIDNEYI